MSPFSLKTRLTTPRYAETVAWYRDLFGMELVEQWDEPGDKGCILALADGSNEALLEICDGPIVAGFSDLSLQFRVDDVGEFKAPEEPRFAARGPVDRPWGSRYLFFTDPNRISVVLFSGNSF
jgi:catechol 2,3-dioxygenase-like lactoylglutathione lyase family enzyme